MKRKIYVITFLILISINVPFISFARKYTNEVGKTDTTDIEKDDSEDEEDGESGEVDQVQG